MPPKSKTPFEDAGRTGDAENMMISTDSRSLRRGRRVAPRTQVCRPCLLWQADDPEDKREGVVMDLNPYGLQIRMLDSFPRGAQLFLQMMRDEEFSIPLSPPIRVAVVRVTEHDTGFVDHGMKVMLAKIKKAEDGRPVRLDRPRIPRRTPTKMHMADFTNERSGRRMGKGRG